MVEEVLRKTKISSSDAYWRSNMEGHCLKVQPTCCRISMPSAMR